MESFDTWVTTRWASLLRFAYFVTHDPHDAQDLLQDALTHLQPRWDRLADPERAESYVRRSIANGAVSAWRKTGRRLVPVPDLPEREAPAPSPEDAVVDAEAAWQLCASLPPDQRTAVVMRFYEDASYTEIADVLGCAEATARSHVHRALTKLRTQLEGADR